jgi:Toxin PAAR-like domain
MPFPAITKGGGMCFAFPDVCKTPSPPAPPVPIPYPNIGNFAQAVKPSTKVKICDKEVLVEGSEVPMSQGDEAGVAGGVISGRNMDKVTVKKGSSKVQVEGKACAHLTCMTVHNGSNANSPTGHAIAPGQVKVMVEA